MAAIQSSLPRPKLACEIAPERVIAARASEASSGGGIAAYSSRNLGPGIVAPSLSAHNVLDGDALRHAIAGSLNEVAGNARDVIAILPDSAVRVVLLDIESLPDKAEDALGFVRFRLRKSLPFDVDAAAVSYHAWQVNDRLDLVAAVTPLAVLREYESAFQDAGYSPGVVQPSMLAALGLIDGSQAALVVKVDAQHTTVAVLDSGQLRLFRQLDLTLAPEQRGADLAENVRPSLVFFEDTYQSAITRIFFTGVVPLAEVRDALEEQTGIRPRELVAMQAGENLSPQALPKAWLSAVLGALA